MLGSRSLSFWAWVFLALVALRLVVRVVFDLARLVLFCLVGSAVVVALGLALGAVARL